MRTDVVDLKKAYDAHEAKLASLRKEKAETFERARRVAEANRIALEMEDTDRHSPAAAGATTRRAKTLLAKAEKQLVDLPLSDKGNGLDPKDLFNIYNPRRRAILSTDGIYQRLVQQYYLTQMELNSPPRVKLIQPASNPTQKDIEEADHRHRVRRAAGLRADGVRRRRVRDDDADASVRSPT